MWNGRKYAAMAIAGAALAAAACGPASAEYFDNGYAGVYGFGWPYAAYGAGNYGVNGAYAYGGSYSSASYGGQEGDRATSVIRLAPARCPVFRRNEPKRLE
jgi:hypothetical protein